jgi:hypothetical protein
MRHGEERGRAEAGPASYEQAADQVGGDAAEQRERQDLTANRIERVAEHRVARNEERVEGGRLRREDVFPERLTMAQRVDSSQIRSLVVVRRRR